MLKPCSFHQVEVQCYLSDHVPVLRQQMLPFSLYSSKKRINVRGGVSLLSVPVFILGDFCIV